MLKKLWFWFKMTEQLDICLMRSLKAMFKQVIDTNQHDGAPGFYTPSFELMKQIYQVIVNLHGDINRNLKIHSSFIGKNQTI